MPASGDTSSSPTATRPRLVRLLPLLAIVAASLTALALGWSTGLSPTILLDRRVAIDAFVAAHRLEALAAFAAGYALWVALSLPGAVFLTLGGGAIFGGLAGGLAVLIGATAGATAIFVIASSALGGWLVRRAGPRVESAAAGFRADAFNYLLFLRLVPLFPFWLVNVAPALFGVRLGTYVGATALGIIPGTFAFAYLGAGLDSAVTTEATAYRACVAAGHAVCRLGFDLRSPATLEVSAGLVVLGLLALAPVLLRRRRRGAKPRDIAGGS
jgi:uncharacterized membrane protein YdjX (TVP38/TMEM64 family)